MQHKSYVALISGKTSMHFTGDLRNDAALTETDVIFDPTGEKD